MPPRDSLPPVYVDIGVAGGLETKADRKLVSHPRVLKADNVSYITTGSVRKRYGISFLPQPSSNDVRSLGATNDELLSTDKSYLYAWSPGSSTWAKRGVAPQCAISTTTIGNYQLPASFVSGSAQVRQLTYDVIGDVGLAAYDIGDSGTNHPFVANTLSPLSVITLVLFDVRTGKTIWTTKFNTPYIEPLLRAFSVANIGRMGVSPPAEGGAYVASGVAYPIIKAFKGQFYIAYLGCVSGLIGALDFGSFAGNVYYVSLMRFGTPTFMASNIPAIAFRTETNSAVTVNATPIYLPVASAGGLTNPAAYRRSGAAAPVTAPIYFDLDTNGNTLNLGIIAQSYGFPPAATPDTANGSPILSYFSHTDVTANTAVECINQTAPTGIQTTPVALDATPRLANGTLPSDAKYIMATRDGFMSMREPPVPGATLQGSLILPAAQKPDYSAPISVLTTGTGAPYTVYVTDGVIFAQTTVNAAGVFASPATARRLEIDYSMDFRATTKIIPARSTMGTPLASRIFLAPDGQPVAWVNVSLFDGSNYNCLCLVNVGNAVTPDRSVYAHAFYLRAGAALVGRTASNVVDGSVLAFQLTDRGNRVAAIKRLSIMARPYPTIVKLNQGALVTGGDTKYYDGQEVRTLGWLKFPELPGIRPANRAGGQLVAGFAYSYVLVWADYDAYGNVIYSSPSDVIYLTSTAEPVVYLSKPVLAKNPPTLPAGTNSTYVEERYATILSPNRGEYIIYRNSSLDSGVYRRIPPLTYVAGTGYFDLSPDDNRGNPQLYSLPSSTSSELPNDPPPPSSFAVTTTKRPFVASAENRSWLYFGKPYFPGRAPEFNAGSFIDVDPPSGDISGLAVLDQNVIIFKKERIFVLGGPGPDATGNGAFNDTYAVATDTGCIDSGSIVTTETGVYFRSIRGIQKIDRSLQVSYAGAPVEAIVLKSTVASAVLVPGQNQIRFALLSNDPLIQGTGADNVVLVYDYLQDKWSTYGFNPGYDPAYSLQLIGQAFWQNNWFGLAGNAIFQDAGPYSTYGVTAFTDGPNKVPMTVETAWIPLAGPLGFGRLRRVNVLGDFRSAHNLSISFAYDYNDTYTHTIPFNPGMLVPGMPQEWRVRAPRQVGQAVKFKIVDDGVGEAAIITALQLETSQKSGAPRLPDAQSV